MSRYNRFPGRLAVILLAAVPSLAFAADGLSNLKRGDLLPTYRLNTLGRKVVSNKTPSNKVGLMVYLSAEQRDSERVAVEADRVATKYGGELVDLTFVTVDSSNLRYFERFREEASIHAPLAVDGDGAYSKLLGLSRFPTTIISDSEGKLAHVIIGRESGYVPTLDLLLRHTLGRIDDAGLEEELKTRSLELSSASATIHPERLRRVDLGAPLPEFRLTCTDGSVLENASFQQRVLVLVYLSAEQSNSDRAVVDAQRVVQLLGRDDLSLLFVTADSGKQKHFDGLFAKADVSAPLAFDEAREFFGKLGLVVFPTTLVIDRNGHLMHVIATRRTNYAQMLDAYARHALGLIDETALAEQLAARNQNLASPKSLAQRHRAVSRLLLQRGLVEGAERELMQAMELDPSDSQIQLDLAELYLKNGSREQCAEIVSSLLKKDTHNRRALLIRGIVLFEEGKLDEAEAILTEALVLNPDPVRALYYLGQVYEKVGKKDQALEQYRKALARTISD